MPSSGRSRRRSCVPIDKKKAERVPVANKGIEER